MVRTIKAGLAFTALAGALLLRPSLHAQADLKQGEMKQHKIKHDGKAKTPKAGKFHGKVHATSGRTTVCQLADGKLILRLSDFTTSNGPDVQVLLVRAEDGSEECQDHHGDADGVLLESPIRRENSSCCGESA
jgi:hypothetical protein